MVRPVQQGQDHPSGQGPETHLVQPLESKDAFVVGDRTVGLEDGTDVLVPLEALNSLADGSDRHLSRQSEALPYLPVRKLVDADLREHLGFKSHIGSERSGLVEPLHRRE